jgi:hypothetical protein
MERNANYSGKVANDLNSLTLEDDQVKYRKDFLGKYLVKLVTAQYDENFIKYLDYVGKIHTAHPGKASKINVEYIHCNALFAFVSSFVVEALMSAGLPHEVEKKTVLAFNKLLWIQNDYFAKWYVKDNDKVKFYSPVSESVVSFVGGVALGATALFLLLKKH